jgi:hypothetical protein
MAVCEEENPNHVTKSEIFCDYLGDKFPVKYSKLGITSFKCPMYGKESWDDIICSETQADNCPIRDRLEKIIKEM